MTLWDHNRGIATARHAWHACGVLVVIVMILFWWGVLGQSVLKERKEIDHQMGQMLDLQEHEQAIKNRLTEVTNELEQRQREDARRRERTSPPHDEAGFLEWVNELAHTSGLKIHDFRPSGQDSQGIYEQHGVSLSSQGSYSGICQFLDRMRDCPRMNRITSMEITPSDGQRKEFSVSLQILLFTQVQPPQSR